MRNPSVVTNRQLAGMLRREAEDANGMLPKAFRRAARSALLWPEEASSLLSSGRSLTELESVGPFLAKKIAGWVKSSPPSLEDARAEESEFLVLSEAKQLLDAHPSWRKKVRADLQMHTSWSDGSASVMEMAQAGAERGYDYIAITDHTKGLKIANGLDEKRLARQAREIAQANSTLFDSGAGLVVLRSAEVNLSPTGEVDMDAAALDGLDIVLGSFHSALRRTDDQTERYLAALRNPCIQILGHPQCRVFGYRLGLRADWSRVFAEAAKLDKAVEIDGYADRQDLKLSLLKLARKEGARISLGTDAHHPRQMAFMDFSLAAACLAKIPSERIINFMPLKKFQQWVGRVRDSQTRRRRK